MSDDGWKDPQTIMFGANAFCQFNLCAALVNKGVLTQQEAANVMVKTANDIRSGSEDGSGQEYGERIASRYEVLASWLLGIPT
ncbi:hypothetical protein K1W69_17540 [Hoeflea sp. WL0058]|uniref:Uncharacterized protein n=1 Tax=Flavimaribacter sediminis TaxID=2865987 RepID=A0AAE2ZLF5_9HYPH|nr:hypothetical protein [Flavimaribacter sediminis]MBW8639004.1 hypothetical protein [Flavimaribacter sediminis]